MHTDPKSPLASTTILGNLLLAAGAFLAAHYGWLSREAATGIIATTIPNILNRFRTKTGIKL